MYVFIVLNSNLANYIQSVSYPGTILSGNHYIALYFLFLLFCIKNSHKKFPLQIDIGILLRIPCREEWTRFLHFFLEQYSLEKKKKASKPSQAFRRPNEKKGSKNPETSGIRESIFYRFSLSCSSGIYFFLY